MTGVEEELNLIRGINVISGSPCVVGNGRQWGTKSVQSELVSGMTVQCPPPPPLSSYNIRLEAVQNIMQRLHNASGF